MFSIMDRERVKGMQWGGRHSRTSYEAFSNYTQPLPKPPTVTPME